METSSCYVQLDRFQQPQSSNIKLKLEQIKENDVQFSKNERDFSNSVGETQSCRIKLERVDDAACQLPSSELKSFSTNHRDEKSSIVVQNLIEQVKSMQCCYVQLERVDDNWYRQLDDIACQLSPIVDDLDEFRLKALDSVSNT